MNAEWRAGLLAGVLALSGARPARPAGPAPAPDAEAMRRELDTIYRVVPVPEPPAVTGELCRAWFDLARGEIAGLRADLKPWPKDPRARLLTDGRHTEHGIRPQTQLMIAEAVVARWSPDDAERRAALDDLAAMLRFVAPTHGAGPLTASDGAKWRGQWQSALWAAQAGSAAWIVWDRLDPELRWLVARMVASEADRFPGATIPYRVDLDTKAEEDAWNAMVVGLAANLLPAHPRAEVWRETAVRWMLSSFLSKADVASDRVVDGRALRDWKLGANIHDDYTLENHGRVHPSYMMTITMNQSQRLFFRWAGRPAPEACDFNTAPIYANLKFFSHPDSQFHFPNGQDWELHRLAGFPHALMNVLARDPDAARLERSALDTCRRMQARTGRSLLPTEYFFPSLPSACAAAYAWCFLAHAWYGEGTVPAAEADLQSRLAGVRRFERGRFIAHRSSEGWASFSWGRQVMGLAIPFAADLMGTPCEGGLVGSVEAEGVRTKPSAPVAVKSLDVAHDTRGFRVRAVLARAGGAVEQDVAMQSGPGGRVIYAERLRTVRDVRLTRVETGMVGVFNEPEWVHQRGPRRLAWEGGQRVVDGREAGTPFDISSPWVRIDERWGFVRLGDGGWRYDPDDRIVRGRREQRLCLAPPAPRSYAAGETVAERAMLIRMGRAAAAGTAATPEEEADARRLLERLRAPVPGPQPTSGRPAGP